MVTLHQLVDYEPDEHGQRLAKIWNAIFDQYPIAADRLQQLLSSPNGAHVVAVASNADVTLDKVPIITGFAICFVANETCGYLSSIGVLPCFQRQRIGSRLVKRACERLRVKGCSSIRVGSVFPRFWCGVPTDLDQGIPQFLVKCGFLKCSDVLAKDLCLNLEGYDPPRDPLLKAAHRGLRFAPWSSGGYQECMQRQRSNFDNAGWVAAYETLAIHNLFHQVMVAFDNDGSQVGWALMIEPDLPVWNDLAFPSLIGEKTALIACVGVDSQVRQRGIGHALIIHAIQDLQSRGMKHVFVDWVVLADWYEKIGFQIWRCYSQYELEHKTGV